MTADAISLWTTVHTRGVCTVRVYVFPTTTQLLADDLAWLFQLLCCAQGNMQWHWQGVISSFFERPSFHRAGPHANDLASLHGAMGAHA